MIPRAIQYVADMNRRHPGLWKWVDQQRQALFRDKAVFGDWCFLPSDSFALLFSADGKFKDIQEASRVARVATPMHSLAAWRVTQGIYRFDKSVYEAVRETPLTRDIPDQILYHLPEYCCYIETPGEENPVLPGNLHGFFVSLDYVPSRKLVQLILNLDTDKGLFYMTIPLGRGSIKEAMEWSQKSYIKEFPKIFFGDAMDLVKASGLPITQDRIPSLLASGTERVANSVARLVSLVLYLCSVSADIRHLAGTDKTPVKPQPVKTKKGFRTFPPDAPNVWEVGYRVGPKLRLGTTASQGVSSGTGMPKRPHVRRAHWHTYWTGSRSDDSRREAKLRWLHAMLVNTNDPDDLVPVIRPVN